MRQHARLNLDRSELGRVPEDCRVIATETEFLRTALKDDAQVVRGESLCHWAEAFWQSRGWPYGEIRSPFADVLTVCPSIKEEQAEALLLALGDRIHSLQQPASAMQLLKLALPEGPWEEIPSPEHSATWLLWLECADIPDYVAPLVECQVAAWESGIESTHRRLYRMWSPTDSQNLVASWIGLQQKDDTEDLGPFPIDVPQRWQQKAREKLKREVVSNGIAVFADVSVSGVPRRLKEIAADEVCSYCIHHCEVITADLINSLTSFLSVPRVQQLRDILPPDPPGAPPEEPEALWDWFEERYLPYREWQAGRDDVEASAIVASVAADFARWYLGYYPVALAGGSGNQHLAMRRSEALRTAREDCVTLWVVLDGLHYVDARRLVSEIADQTEKLQVVQVSTTFTAIPTITRFAKPALINGLPPAQSEVFTSTAPHLITLTENADPKSALGQAKKGDAFLWCHTEPDKTYHKPLDRSTIADNVYGVLRSLARKIAQAAEAVPSELPLRIVVSTDHGRLIGGGRRTHTIPAGMEAEGRAAYGTSGICFDESGLKIAEQDRLVMLQRERFGLPVDCAIVLDEDAFVMSDGKGGSGHFPHGGLFPEEIIIPWIELHRAMSMPDLECVVSGKARPTFDGRITLQLSNMSDARISLSRFVLSLTDGGSRLVDLEGTVGPYSPLTVTALMRGWPTYEQIREAVGRVTCRLENGTSFDAPVRLVLESEQMYKQDTTLEDLM